MFKDTKEIQALKNFHATGGNPGLTLNQWVDQLEDESLKIRTHEALNQLLGYWYTSPQHIFLSPVNALWANTHNMLQVISDYPIHMRNVLNELKNCFVEWENINIINKPKYISPEFFAC